MSSKQNGFPEGDNGTWSELSIPGLLLSNDAVRGVHEAIECEWDSVRRSACQTAAGRALWKQVIDDPLAELFAGETYLKSIYEKIRKDLVNNAREISGVIIAVRTLWFDSKLEAALRSFQGGGGEESQVVLLGAGMDARPYRLGCLRESAVFEVDFPEVLKTKAAILEAAVSSGDEHHRPTMKAKTLKRVAADLRDGDWLEKLKTSGFEPRKTTVWILEGILYYLSQSHAMNVLKVIAEKCDVANTVFLADFMNKQATALSSSTFNFYCDWPELLLPSLGFSEVKLSQIGDPDANFGLLKDPLSLLNKLRNLHRSVQIHPDDGTPCSRLYLLEASGSPKRS
ncbi:hypothetical protein M569_05305, partial [Genlisea aurea]